MERRTFLVGLAPVLLAACGGRVPEVPLGPDGQPLPRVFQISEADAAQIPGRMLEGVNALRSAAGVAPVQADPRLATAAATHSRDMSVQNRPWHFGSDGSTPVDRLARAGYAGPLIGEAISETYEDDITTLAAWTEDPETRPVILDPRARAMGIAWFQEGDGKLWWTLVMGG